MMTPKQEAAMRQALEALKLIDEAMPFPVAKFAQAALREALAEQPAQQQEPVATDWERIARVQDAKLRAMCDEPGGFEKLCEVMDRYERTSPQSKPWVGLTEDERLALAMHENFGSVTDYAHAIEAKLREKNNG